MSDLDVLIGRNQHFAQEFAGGELPMKPSLSTVVLTCLDARVDPGRFFELELGDAAVLRNAGGRVTNGVLRDLAVVGFLAGGIPGGPAMKPEIVIVHHTQCGMARLADPEAQRVLGERMGVEPSEVAEMAVSDPSQSVQADVDRLRRTPGLPETLVVSGFVYDVADGTVSQIVEPAPLGRPS